MKIFAESLAKEANELVIRIQEGRTSLATLAADAGTLAYQFASLRVDIINIHEKRQRELNLKLITKENV